jgi:hypothetical protein
MADEFIKILFAVLGFIWFFLSLFIQVIAEFIGLIVKIFRGKV